MYGLAVMLYISKLTISKYIDKINIFQSVSNFAQLKVNRFQKKIFLFSFEPKKQTKSFFFSALASKMIQIKKMKALYYITICN